MKKTIKLQDLRKEIKNVKALFSHMLINFMLT